MASMTPGREDVRPARPSSPRTPPSNSVTCASSETCGPWEMIQPGVPNALMTSDRNSSPRPSALVNTTGASTWAPRCQAEVPQHRWSRNKPTWAAAARMASWTACARCIAGARGARQVDVEQRLDEVKSPTSRSTIGMQRLWRPNSGTFSRNREAGRPKRASALANAAGQRHRRGDATGAGGGKQRVASRRVQPVPPPAAYPCVTVPSGRFGVAPADPAAAGGRCAHCSRSASRGRLLPRLLPRDGPTVSRG